MTSQQHDWPVQHAKLPELDALERGGKEGISA